MRPQARFLPSIRPNRMIGAAAVAVLGLAAAGAASAQGIGSRADTWEFTVAIPYVASQTVDADGGTEVDLNSDVGLGFGLGYNFDDKLSLSVDVAWGSPSYEADVVLTDEDGNPIGTNQQNGELDTSNWQVNLRYNFMPGKFTPFVSGGLGWTYVDTNVPSEPPGLSCWWDPWYGNICYTYQETYSDWRFSYNAMAGLRWDLNQTVFLRAAVGMQWLDLDSGSQDFTGGRVEVGFTM